MGGGFWGRYAGIMKKHPGLRVDQTSKQTSCMGNLDGMSPFFLVHIVWVGVMVCRMAFLDLFSWDRFDKLSILE